MNPIISYSELTRRWYIVTSYKVDEKGHITARKKFDVTDELYLLIKDYGIPRFSK